MASKDRTVFFEPFRKKLKHVRKSLEKLNAALTTY